MTTKEQISPVTTLELRLGNWVLFKNYYQVQVTKLEEDFFTARNEDEVFVDWEENEECSGILLTAEILKRCGFVARHAMTPGQYEINFYTLGKLTIGERRCQFDFANINVPEYLHQMQNLYFALTGIELEYEP